MDGSFWQAIAQFLMGVVLTGAIFVIRGDFLGSKAANDVEKRLNARMDREMRVVMLDLKEIKDALNELLRERREVKR